MTEEDALWAAVGATPDDRLPRLVLADWYDENGRPELAAALRATADRVPIYYDSVPAIGVPEWTWWEVLPHTDGDTYERERDYLTTEVHAALRPTEESALCSREANYKTAAAAIRDLCRAWVAVHTAEAVR